jgi:rubredoxin
MTIKIGGLGQEISCYCPVCSEKMIHMCIATLGTGSTIRYAWECRNCELSLKSDKDGNAKLIKELSNG